MRKIDASGKTLWSVWLSARAEARSRPNGFSTATRACVAQPDSREAVDHRGEGARRDGEVVQRPLGAAELAAQALEGGGVGVVAVDVAQERAQLVERAAIEAAVMLEAVACARAQLLERPARLGDADDRHVQARRGGPSPAAPGRSACRRDRRWRRRRPARPNGCGALMSCFSSWPPNSKRIADRRGRRSRPRRARRSARRSPSTESAPARSRRWRP